MQIKTFSRRNKEKIVNHRPFHHFAQDAARLQWCDLCTSCPSFSLIPWLNNQNIYFFYSSWAVVLFHIPSQTPISLCHYLFSHTFHCNLHVHVNIHFTFRQVLTLLYFCNMYIAIRYGNGETWWNFIEISFDRKFVKIIRMKV